MQVWLPAPTEASTLEAGADIKECALFRYWPSGRWGTHVTKPIFWAVGGLLSVSPSPHLNGDRGFYKERGIEQRDKG